MGLILYLLTAALILLNLAGLGLAATRLFPRFALALPAALLGLALSLFFIEHFAGFGAIRWLWPFTTVAAAYSVYIHRASIKLQRTDLIAYAAGFAYGFVWRMAYPDLSPSSEHMTDLFFIANYMPGATLPPEDVWQPGQKFDYYYAFQHYSAALLGRLFGLDGGTAYNFAYCLVFGFLFSLAWFAASIWTQGSKRRSAIIVMALMVGGTGLSPFYHFLYPSNIFNSATAAEDTTRALWANTRFIGLYDRQANSPFALTLLGENHAAIVTPELPFESIGYITSLGDFHPPLGGFALLLFALACIAWLEQQPDDKRAQALLAFSVPLTLATNAWVFPLQGLLVGAWALLRVFQRRPPDWKMLIAGAAIGMVLLVPFLTHLATRSQSVGLRWLRPEDHASMVKVLLQIWPLIALTVLGLWQIRSRKNALLFCLMVIGVLTFTSLLHFEDAVGGIYKRFNTTLKWWSWIQVLAVVALGAIGLGTTSKIIRYSTLTVLLLISTYGIELARYWVHSPPTAAGKMAGHHWLTQDSNQKDLLNYLRAAPRGVVLENITGGAYNKSGAFSLFAGKPSVLTWPDHLNIWKGNMNHMRILQNQITQFYAGQKDDLPGWLQANKVRYIIWLPEFNTQAFDQIKPQIEAHYHWKPFDLNPSVRLGIWVLK